MSSIEIAGLVSSIHNRPMAYRPTQNSARFQVIIMRYEYRNYAIIVDDNSRGHFSDWNTSFLSLN